MQQTYQYKVKSHLLIVLAIIRYVDLDGKIIHCDQVKAKIL